MLVQSSGVAWPISPPEVKSEGDTPSSLVYQGHIAVAASSKFFQNSRRSVRCGWGTYGATALWDSATWVSCFSLSHDWAIPGSVNQSNMAGLLEHLMAQNHRASLDEEFLILEMWNYLSNIWGMKVQVNHNQFCLFSILSLVLSLSSISFWEVTS